MRPLPTDFAEYRRRRRRARLATVIVGLAAANAVLVMVVTVRQGGDSRPAIVPYLGLVMLAVVAWFVVVPLWRRSAAARPVVQQLDPTPGQVFGIPELDADPQAHQGLSGQVDPPTRW